MAEKATSKNIYQRMIEVQKKVTSVQKDALVKMSENDRGYKAVTHDDVAAALHLPLAEAGIVMLPDVEEFTLSDFEKTNQWGKTVTWYRTDIKILVKWINADNPEDFIVSKGAAFALDTSDKSFAKAYSLALKIVLLKVHLLESRDGEEERPFDQAHGGEKAGKGEKQQPRENPQPKQEQKHLSPNEVIMPFGSAKGKKIGDLDTETLEKASQWLKSEMAKDPKPANIKQIAFIYAQVKAVLSDRTPPPPDKMPEDMIDGEIQDFPPDDIQEHSPELPHEEPKKIKNYAPGADDQQKKSPDDEIIPCEIPGVPDIKGKMIKQLSEDQMRKVIASIDQELKKSPTVKNMSELFKVRIDLKTFLQSVGVEL